MAFPKEAAAVAPHSSDGFVSSTCRSCHSPHQASPDANVILSKAQSALCLFCHDGTGATTQSTVGPTSFEGASGHVLENAAEAEDLTNTCSSCHTPHGDATVREKLPSRMVNGVPVSTAGNDWCLACHNDDQEWYAGSDAYPSLAEPLRDASGYPTSGVFAGATVYNDPAANGHLKIPASTEPTRTAGDCRYCHNSHSSASPYDSLVAALSPSTEASVANDRATGAYAELCISCHDGETPGATNIKQFVTAGAEDAGLFASGGHRIKSAGGTLPPNAPLPCYDCHNPHGSSRGNTKLISDALGSDLDTGAGPEAVRKFCLSCHVTFEGYGWDSIDGMYAVPPVDAEVEGLLRSGGAYGDGNHPDGGYNWLRLKETPGHLLADATVSCYECHGDDYESPASSNVHNPGSYSGALHASSPADATIWILGVDYGLRVCADCHSLDLGAEHAKQSSSSSAASCAACHPAPRGSLTEGWDKSCAQGDCHTVTSTAPMHAEVDVDHTAPDISCTVAGCHAATSGVAALHSEATTMTAGGELRTSCAVCHSAGVPATVECVTCHSGDPHPTADHTVGGPCAASGCHLRANEVHSVLPEGGCSACHSSGETPSFVCSDCHTAVHQNPPAVPPTHRATTVTCDACHSIANIVTIHGDNCATCHGVVPESTIAAWNLTCEQAGCHVAPLHPSPDQQYSGHDYHNEGANCWPCHDLNLDYAPCAACHGPVYDRVAPTTTSDAVSSYSGTAVITLTASDPDLGDDADAYNWTGNWGVKTLYYQIDGGPLQVFTPLATQPSAATISTTITIEGPSTGAKSHTVEFWALDNRGNTESPHQKFGFTITAIETIPPVTGSDVQTSYIGMATITLSPTDAGGSGLMETYYSLDGGPQLVGTSITVPAPVVGPDPVPHVLEWWSVDNAGNVEMPHNTAAFTVSAIPDNTAPVGTITINGGDPFTSSTTVTLTLTASDTVSGLGDMCFSNNGTNWSDWEAFAAARTWVLTAVEGDKTVYVKFRDLALNESSPYSDDIYLTGDVAAPTGTMSINSGAAWTDSVYVTVASAVADIGSGMDQMRFHAVGVGTDWGPWVNYSNSTPLTLPAGEDGERVVLAEYRDKVNNVLGLSDTIVLDTVGPVGTMAVAEGAIETASTSVVVSSLMADATSGMHQMSVDPGTGLFGGWIAYTADYTITLPSFPYGEKTVRVQYRDNAGNVSLRTDTITLVAPIGNATLAFIWHPSGSNSATLHVENSSGVTIAGPVTKSGGGTALDWSVTVPSGQNYRMVVDYYYDESNDDEGGPYSIWCNDLLNNRGEPMVTSGSMPGVLEPNETITWYY